MIWSQGHQLQSGKYRIIRELGRGGFGLTYLAEDWILNRPVVIKAPNRQFQADQEYKKFIRRFQREGQVLAKISHFNVVQVIDFFQEAGVPCLVMAYVDGETLYERIRNQGPLSENEAVEIFRKLATALQTVHQAGLIHCDIHPGNIMLRRQSGEPVLIDLGSAKSLQPATFTVTTTVNQNFTPYEQGRQGRKRQPTLDIYALAATLYFAITGEKPEEANNRIIDVAQKKIDPLKSPQEYQPGLSDWLNQAILQGMALEAGDRPQSMQKWLGFLHPAQDISRNSIFATVWQGFHLHVWKGLQITPQQTKSSQSSWRDKRKRFNQPLIPLGVVFLGYLPIGSLLILSNAETIISATVVVIAVALAAVGSWNGAVAKSVATAVSGIGIVAVAAVGDLMLAVAGPVALAGAMTVVGAVAVAKVKIFTGVGFWAGSWAGTIAGIVSGAIAGSLDGSVAEIIGEVVAGAIAGTIAGTIAGAVVAYRIGFWAVGMLGAIAGAVAGARAGIEVGTWDGTIMTTAIDFWAGVIFGVLAGIQSFMIGAGINFSNKSLKKSYNFWLIFRIIGITSTLGLVLGGVIGWWLK